MKLHLARMISKALSTAIVITYNIIFLKDMVSSRAFRFLVSIFSRANSPLCSLLPTSNVFLIIDNKRLSQVTSQGMEKPALLQVF